MKNRIFFFLPLIFITLSICSAVVPYGGVSIWAQTLTGILALVTFVISVALFDSPTTPKTHKLLGVKIALLSLAAWICIHSVLLGLLDIPDVGNNTILLSKLYIWLAFFAIGWSSSKLCRNRQLLKYIATAIVLIGSSQAAFGILALYSDVGVFNTFISGKRAVGTFSSGNSFGGFLLLSLLITLGLTLTYVTTAIEYIAKRGRALLHISTREDYIIFKALALVFATIIQLIAIILSGSRGAIFSMALTSMLLLLWFGFQNRKSKSKKYTLPVILALFGFIVLIGAGGTYAAALSRMQELSQTHNSALPRLAIWRGALDMISTYPWGTGLGSFSSVYHSFQPAGFNVSRVYHAHNDYLEMLAELGIPGMIALLAALAILLLTTAKYIFRPTHGTSIWIRRSSFLALIAALIHACVDFNLSSRPGVTILFFTLLGIAVSKPETERIKTNSPHTKHSSLRSHTNFRINRLASPTLTLLLIIILPLMIHQIRLCSSSILMRQGFAALGGSPSKYFMLPTPALSQNEALEKLKRSTLLTPGYSHAHVMRGRGFMLAHARKVEKLLKSTLKQGTLIPESSLRNQISIAMRPEEIKAVNQAAESLQTALNIAPDSLNANAYYVDILGKQALLSSNQNSFKSHLKSLLLYAEKTKVMAPNDLTSNRIIFFALTKASHSQYVDSFPILKNKLIEFIQQQGIHLLQLNTGIAKDVLAIFSRLNIEPSTILNTKDLFIPVIWNIYQYYNKTENASQALKALNALSIAVNPQQQDGTLDTNNAKIHKFNIFSQKQINSQRKRYKSKLIRERSKWLLRIHDFKSYSKQAYTKPMEITVPVDSKSIACKHRQRLNKAKTLIKENRYKEARSILLSLVEAEPNDPDIHKVLIQHAKKLDLNKKTLYEIIKKLRKISPEIFIGMQFRNKSIELTGITVDPDILQTYWRFRAPVPADLQATVLFRDDNNKGVFYHSIKFQEKYPVEFGSGNPKLGSIFKIDFTLPESVSKSSRLIIGLRQISKVHFVKSEESLPYCELFNWHELINQTHIFRNQIIPPPNVSKAYDISNNLPINRFSHNLYRIANKAEFYPLLDGKRQTTTNATWQPCLSASGLVACAVSAADNAFKNNPNLDMFSLGINDGQDWCQCGACKLICPKKEQHKPASQRWWSEPYWQFVNTVASEIKESHPDKRIGAIAYSNVVKPPSFKLQNNITVYLCQDAGSHFDPKQKSRDAKRLRDWINICSDVGVYNYAGLVSWIFPRYCRDEIAADIKLASGLGVEKFYIENVWIKGLDGPLPWITKKLIQDPSLDAKALQKTFCKYTYGSAAKAMNLYFDYLQEIWKSADHGKWFDGLFIIKDQARRYPPDVRREMYRLLQNARKDALGNTVILNKISEVESPLILSEAFAKEYDLMQTLTTPITDMKSLNTAKETLTELQSRILERNRLLENLSNYAWGKDAIRALSSSKTEKTIDRWNNQQRSLTNEVHKTIEIIQNAINYGIIF